MVLKLFVVATRRTPALDLLLVIAALTWLTQFQTANQRETVWNLIFAARNCILAQNVGIVWPPHEQTKLSDVQKTLDAVFRHVGSILQGLQALAFGVSWALPLRYAFANAFITTYDAVWYLIWCRCTVMFATWIWINSCWCYFKPQKGSEFQ